MGTFLAGRVGGLDSGAAVFALGDDGAGGIPHGRDGVGNGRPALGRAAGLRGGAGVGSGSQAHGLIGGVARLELAAQLARERVHQIDRSARHGIDGTGGLRDGIGDLGHIFQNLVDAHEFQIRRVNRERQTLHQRIDAAHGGLGLLGDLVHAGKQRVDLIGHQGIHMGDEGVDLGGDLLHVLQRGGELLMGVVDGRARRADGERQFHDEPYEHRADEHVDDGQRDVHDPCEIHDEPPCNSEDLTIPLLESF